MPAGIEAGRVRIRVLPDTSSFPGALKRYLQRVERTTSLKLGVKLDSKQIRAEAKRIAAAAEKAAKVKLETGLDTDGLAAQARRAVDNAERHAGSIKIGVDVDPSRLLSLAASAVKLVVATAAIAHMASAVANLGHVLAAIAPAAGALLLLPAAAVAGAIAMGTLRIAFLGVSDALSAGLSGDTEKYAEALEKLAPAAQATVKEIVALKPAFEGLQQSVQGAVFDGMAERVQTLAQLYLPLLTTQLTAVGTAFNLAFTRTADMAAMPGFVADIDTLLTNLQSTFSELSGVVAPLLSAFKDLAVVGSEFLPGLTSGAADAASAFAGFIANARETGQLASWISGALDVLGQLGFLAQDVGGIVTGVFKAMGASGGDALGPLGQLADVLNTVVNSAGGQAGLSAIFGALSSVATALEPVLGAVAVAAVPLAEIFADLVTALGPGVTDVIKSLGKGLEAIAPVAGPVGVAISDILQAVAPLLPVFGELVATLLGPLAELLSAVAKEGAPLVKMFAEEMAPILPRLADALMEMVHAFTPLLPHFARLTSELLPILVPLLNLVAVAVIGIAAVLTALGPVISFVLDLISDWVGLAKDLWGAITSIDFGAVGEKITEFASNALQAVGDFLTDVGTYLSELPGKFMDFISEATSTGLNYFNTGVTTIVGAAAQIPSKIYNAASSLVSRLSNLISSAVSSAAQAMWNGIGDITSAAASIPGAILRTLMYVGTLLYDSGSKIVGGLIAGIKARIGELTRTVSNMIDKVKGYLPFSPAKTGPFSGRGNPFYSGLSIGRLFAQGLDRQRDLVSAAANRLTSSAAASVGPIAGGVVASPAPATALSADAALVSILERLDNLQMTLADGAGVVFARLSNEGNRIQGRR